MKMTQYCYRRSGGWVIYQIYSSRIQYTQKNWTQSDLRFSENEESKRSKINENRDQLDWKSRRKLIQNALNLLNSTFEWNNRPTLGPSISGTKCDRDKLFFSAERKEGVNLIVLMYKKGRNWIGNPQNGGHHGKTFVPCPSMRIPTLGVIYVFHMPWSTITNQPTQVANNKSYQ